MGVWLLQGPEDEGVYIKSINQCATENQTMSDKGAVGRMWTKGLTVQWIT